FASTLFAHRKKFDSRTRQYVFLGYKPHVKSYILLDTESRVIFVSRNTTFHETIFPFLHQHTYDHTSPIRLL
ncbi:hypothetical protein ES319_D08G166200v1, partial [Gossypium barbadense]